MVCIIKNISIANGFVKVTTSFRHFININEFVILYGLRKNTFLNNKFQTSSVSNTTFEFRVPSDSILVEEAFSLIASYYLEKWKTHPVLYRDLSNSSEVRSESEAGEWKVQTVETCKTVELGSLMSLGTAFQIGVFMFAQVGNLVLLRMGTSPKASASKTTLNDTFPEAQISRAESIVLVEENFPSMHNIQKLDPVSLQTFTESFLNIELGEIASNTSTTSIHPESQLNHLTDNLATPMANMYNKNPQPQMLTNLQSGLVGHVEADLLAQLSMKQSPQQLTQIFQQIENKVGSYQFWMSSKGHGQPIKWINQIYTAPTTHTNNFKLEIQTDLLSTQGELVMMNSKSIQSFDSLYIASVIVSTPIIGHSAIIIEFNTEHLIGFGDFLLVLDCRTFIITSIESPKSVRVSVEREEAEATGNVVKLQKTPVLITSSHQKPNTYLLVTNAITMNLDSTNEYTLSYTFPHLLKNQISPTLYLNGIQMINADFCKRRKLKGNVVSRFVENLFDKPCTHDHWCILDEKRVKIKKESVTGPPLTDINKVDVSMFPCKGYECIVQIEADKTILLFPPPLIEEFAIDKCFLLQYNKEKVVSCTELPVINQQGLVFVEEYIQVYNEEWIKQIQKQQLEKVEKSDRFVVSFHPFPKISNVNVISNVTFSSNIFGQNHRLTLQFKDAHNIHYSKWDPVTYGSTEPIYFDIVKVDQTLQSRMQLDNVVDSNTLDFKIEKKDRQLESSVYVGALLCNPITFSCSAYRLWLKSLEVPILCS